jgi:hypothetical protein
MACLTDDRSLRSHASGVVPPPTFAQASWADFKLRAAAMTCAPRPVLERVGSELLEVDDATQSQRTRLVPRRPAAASGNVGAERHRELRHRTADATKAAMDEDGLARLQLRLFDQIAPRGHAHDRQRSGLFE